MIVVSDFRFTRNLFLRCVSLVYAFAFASLYVQIPGLYGDNGILPAKNQLDAATESDYRAQIQKKPTLLWFARYLGLSTEYMMDVLSLAGIFLAFTGFISTKACVKPLFAGLWSLYYSLYQVGQTFMWFQWDILLLEAGLLCVIVSPLWQRSQKPEKAITFASRGGSKAPPPLPPPPSQAITMWLVRWLLFRLLFSSGVVKLTSGCPQWWGLTALKIHFESMCLPTPLAWYSHHLPDSVLKLTTVFAIVADILLPFFFYVPVRLVRIWAFFIQLFLQVAIILTGNFNFFNYLVVGLLISLLDDTFFNKNKKTEVSSSKIKSFLKFIVAVALYAGLVALTVHFFGIKFNAKGVLDAKIQFNNKDVEKMLTVGLPVIFLAGAVSLALTSFVAFNAVLKSIFHPTASMVSFIGSLLSTITYSIIAAAIFADSLVPLSGLAPGGNSTIPEPIKEWHASLSHMHVTNSYGMMRRITGVGGRPEVIIEYATNKEGPWKEYKFRYKPGSVDGPLPWVAPHQPRLDWHMWFAALGTYHQNPWVMSLAYRLLQQEPSVLALLHQDHHIPARVAPKFVRAQLYHYHYTPEKMKDTNLTWTRHKLNEYFPVFTVDHPPLIEYLQKVGILAKPGKQIKKEKMDPTLREYLDMIRRLTTQVDPAMLMFSIFSTGIILILAGKLTGSSGSSSSSSGAKQSQTKKQQPKKK